MNKLILNERLRIQPFGVVNYQFKWNLRELTRITHKQLQHVHPVTAMYMYMLKWNIVYVIPIVLDNVWYFGLNLMQEGCF